MTAECSEPHRSAEQGCVAPARSTEVSATLLKIWQDLLHVSTVSPTDDFFELGGDSLGAIRMLERIGREFGDELLEPDVIYTASTFKELADAITSALAQSQQVSLS